MNKPYIIYDEGGDTEIFERPDGTREKNEFVFTGFDNGIHPYHKKQLKWAIEMLNSVGIPLHLKEVSTVDSIGRNADQGEFEIGDLYIAGNPFTRGKRNLMLIQDTEMGRGWAVLVEIKSDGSMDILTQDHRDTVRDQTLLDEKWLKQQGVNFKRKTVKNIDKIK